MPAKVLGFEVWGLGFGVRLEGEGMTDSSDVKRVGGGGAGS